MKVFITKRALTEGIQEVDGFDFREPSNVSYMQNGKIMDAFDEGKEWHHAIESAISRACDMRIRKIAALEKQIEKLKKMEFKK